MGALLATAFALLVGLHRLQRPAPPPPRAQRGGALPAWLPLRLPDPIAEPTRYCYEVFAWRYTAAWILAFGLVVATGAYEAFDAWGYLGVCGGLALPVLLQPLLHPRASAPAVDGARIASPDAGRRLRRRYAAKAAVYLTTYAFIGNYWYTHYFYSVLGARYTMPAHRVNDVPLAMYLATTFYFCTYHAAIGNGVLRHVDRSYRDGPQKTLLFWCTVLFLSYLTAFLETLTISSFPYYSFEDRTLAYVWGSAFYGLYFVVSFPGFYSLDARVDEKDGPAVTLFDAFTTACGHGMMILVLLDFVRLYLGIPLVVGGVAFAATQ